MQPGEPAGEAVGADPDHLVVGGVADDPVAPDHHAGVEGGVDLGRLPAARRLVPRLGDHPVAVGVEHGRAPALRRDLVAGLVPHLRVDPADDLPAAAEVQRVVLVLGELQVVGAEAGVDHHELAGVGLVVDGRAEPAVEGEVAGEPVVRPLTAVVRIGPVPDGRGHPHPPLLVHHRVVGVGGVVPDQLVTEEPRRGRHRHRDHARHRGRVDPQRHVQARRHVGDRIEDGQRVVRDVDPVNGTVRVDLGVALVGGDLVVDVVDVGAPLPHRDDDVPLDALRAGRRLGHRAGRDAVAPVREHLQPPGPAEAVHDVGHLAAALAHLHPVVPRLEARVELLEVVDLADDAVAELVAEHAALLLHVEPLVLVLEVGGDAVAVGPRPRELVLRRRPDQRVPVVGGIDRRGLAGGRGNRRREVHRVARRRLHRGGVDEAVAAHPDVVGGVRQVRDEVPAAVAGHHALHELRGQPGGLGDHPHPLLGAVRARHDAADVVLGGPHERGERDERRRHEQRNGRRTCKAVSHGCLLSTCGTPPSRRSRTN